MNNGINFYGLYGIKEKEIIKVKEEEEVEEVKEEKVEEGQGASLPREASTTA